LEEERDFFSHLSIYFVHEKLLVFVFLNALFHEAEGFGDDLAVEI
jgi:hypothetical protein